MIEETIDKLKALQDILSQKFQIQRQIADLPRALSTKNELVNRLKKSYIEKNALYEEAKKRLLDVRHKMQEAERDREKYEQQMDLIKTQREYEALDKEIREASVREQQFRRDVQREEKALEEMTDALEREQGMIEDQEKELTEEQDKIKSETAKREHRLKELAKEEKDLIPGLDEELLFKFERIIRSKEGEGIVPLRRNVCTGCQMILPAQMVNDVRRGEHILFCPYCSKVIFYSGEDEVDTDGGFIEGDEEGLADLVDDGDLADLYNEDGADEDEEAELDEERLVVGDEDEEDEEDEGDEEAPAVAADNSDDDDEEDLADDDDDDDDDDEPLDEEIEEDEDFDEEE